MRCDTDAWSLHLDRDLDRLAELRIDAALRNRWLLQLQSAWRSSLWTWFPHIELEAPNFVIDTARGRWGYWQPGRRVLGISERLLACYSWHDVLETLRHELAHQLVDEHFQVREAPHGPCFQRTCAKMGVAPAASARPSSLNDRDPDDDPVLRKVRKLLRLGGSDNEHESRLAIRKAHSLLLKHNLSLLEAQQPRGYVVRFCGPVRKRVDSLHMAVGNLLRSFFFVESIWNHCYDPVEDRDGRALMLIGSADNVRFAEHVFEFLYASLERLWRRHKKARGLRRNRDRRSFQRGVLDGFTAQLSEQRSGDRERGLVWVGDAALQTFYRQRFPRTRTRYTRARIPKNDAYHAGHDEGQRLRILRPVESAHGDRGLRLGGGGESV